MATPPTPPSAPEAEGAAPETERAQRPASGDEQPARVAEPHVPAPPSQAAGSRVPELDGLRGVAVLLVVFAHFAAPRADLAGPSGVILFFVLSGYLITGILRSQIDTSGLVDYRGFYERRAARLLPAVTLVAAISPLLMWAVGDPRLGSMLMAELLTLGYMQDVARGLGLLNPLEHTWSLAVEEQFYLLWPVTAAWLLRRGPKRALAAVVGAAVVLAGWHLVSAVVMSGIWTYFAFDTNACFLAAGCALALRRQPGRVSRLLGPITGTALLAEVCAAGAAWSQVPDRHWMIRNVLTIAVGVAAVALVASAPAIPVLRSRILRWFGTISYSLYLWHYVFLTLLPGGTALCLAWRVVAVAAAIGVSAASWQFIEAPILRRSAIRSSRLTL